MQISHASDHTPLKSELMVCARSISIYTPQHPPTHFFPPNFDFPPSLHHIPAHHATPGTKLAKSILATSHPTISPHLSLSSRTSLHQPTQILVLFSLSHSPPPISPLRYPFHSFPTHVAHPITYPHPSPPLVGILLPVCPLSYPRQTPTTPGHTHSLCCMAC